MIPLKIACPAASSTGHRIGTNVHASGATEALQLNQSNESIARQNDLRKELTRQFKSSLLASLTVEADSLANMTALPMETAANDLMQAEYLEASLDPPEAPVAPAAPVVHPPDPIAPVAPILRYKLRTDAEMHKLPAIHWWIKNLLPSRGLAVVFGPSGSGKSVLVLDMLQRLAVGGVWFGYKVKPCSATYIVLEGEAGVAGRIKAYQFRHGSTSSNICYVAQPFNITDKEDIEELAEAILAAGAGGVVVVDTLSRAIPGLDENGSKDMGLIIAGAKKLQELIGGLLLLVHHTGKDASKGVRGHSSLFAALDCAIEVKRSGEHREWIVAKSKDGEDGALHPFKLEVVHLGTDDVGDPITSCVVVPNQLAQAVAKKMPTLGSNQTIAHKAVQELIGNASDLGNEGAPTSGAGVFYDEALAIVASMMPGEAKHQKQRAKEAIGSLVTKGFITEKEGWLTHNQSP